MPIQSGNYEAPVNTLYLGAVTGTSSSSGVFASFANPTGATIFVHEVYMDITTQSSGASTLDIGIAADATTSSDTLIDGVSGAAVLRATILKNGGTNGRNGQKVTASQYINVAEASGNVDALVGALYIVYSVVPV